MSADDPDDIRLTYRIFRATRSMGLREARAHAGRHPDLANDPGRRARVGEWLSRMRQAHPDTQVVDFAEEFDIRLLPDLETRFRVTGPEIGRGGLGVILPAVDLQLGREVAIKRILLEAAGEPGTVRLGGGTADLAALRRLFLYEAIVTGKLEHPGVVPVYGVGLDGRGRPYFAMRRLEGYTLWDLIRRAHWGPGRRPEPAGGDPPRDGPEATPPGAPRRLRPDGARRLVPSEDEVTEMIRHLIDVCYTIQAAHDHRAIPVIHRDLKPEHVHLGPHDETIVLDWGLAVKKDERAAYDPAAVEVPGPEGRPAGITRGLHIAGTLLWMAPEQAEEGGDVGPRTDIFAIGGILYAILTGVEPRGEMPEDARPPREEGDDPRRALRKAIADFVRRPIAFPPREARSRSPLRSIAERALRLDPRGEFRQPEEIAEELLRWIRKDKVLCHEETLFEHLMRLARRHRAAVAIAVPALVAISLTLAGWMFTGWRHALRIAELSRSEQDEARKRELGSLVSAADEARMARSNDYTRVASGWIGRAVGLEPDDGTRERLRDVAVGCMGDFTGRAPQPGADEFPVDLRAWQRDEGRDRVGIGWDGTSVLGARRDGSAVVWTRGAHPAEGRTIPAPGGPSDRAWVHQGAVIAAGPRRRLSIRDVGRDGRWRTIAERGADARPVPGEPAPGGWRRAVLSPDRRILALLDAPGRRAFAWEVRDGGLVPIGEPLAIGDAPADRIAVAGRPEGLLLAVTSPGEDRLMLRCYRRRDGRWPSRPEERGIEKAGRSARALACDEAGAHICVCADIVAVFEAEGLNPAFAIRGDQSSDAAFSPDGHLLASLGDQLREIRIWSVPRRRQVAVLGHENQGTVLAVGFSRVGRRIGVASLGQFRSWDRDAAPERRELAGHTMGVPGVAYHPDGRRLASASKDRTVVIWDVDGRRALRTIDLGATAQAVAFSPDGRWLLAGDWRDNAGRVRLGPVDRPLTAIDWPGLGPEVWCVAFSPGGDAVAASGTLGLGIRPFEGGAVRGDPVPLSTARVKSFTFDRSGRYIGWIEVDDSGGPPRLRVRDLGRRESREIDVGLDEQTGPTETALGLTSPGAGQLAYVSRSRRIMAVSPGDAQPAPRPLFQIEGAVDIGAVLAASPGDGPTRLAVQAGLHIEVWESTGPAGLGPWTRLFRLDRGPSIVWAVAWDPSGRSLAVASSDGELSVWSIDAILGALRSQGLDPSPRPAGIVPIGPARGR